jgi:DNA helicase TIP49 (TBP-interacting protein)
MTGQRRRRLGVRSWREVLGRLEGAGTNVQVLAMQPTLLVGPAGSGKSRLAMRIAEELGVPRLDVGL